MIKSKIMEISSCSFSKSRVVLPPTSVLFIWIFGGEWEVEGGG